MKTSLARADTIFNKPIQSFDLSYSETVDLLEYDYGTDHVTTTTATNMSYNGKVSDNDFKQVGDYEYYNENPIIGGDERAASAFSTDFQGCKDAQSAYAMDSTVLGVDCGTDFNQKPDECAIQCKRPDEQPGIATFLKLTYFTFEKRLRPLENLNTGMLLNSDDKDQILSCTKDLTHLSR